MPIIEEIRAKYPQYSDMSDADLAGALHQKFYADMPREQFDAKVGLTAAPKAAEPSIGMDVAKSAGTGFVKGALETIGTPAKPIEGLVEAARQGGKAMGLPVPDQPVTYAGLMQSGIEKVTGPFHKPETTEGKVAEVGASIVPGFAIPGGGTKSAGRALAPTREFLKDAAKAAYSAPEVTALELRPSALQSATAGIETALKDAGYRDYLAPKTFQAIKELENIGGNQAAKVADFEGVRRALQKAAGDPAEKDAARRAINALEDHLENINPNDVLAGDLKAATDTLKNARGDYAAGARSDRVTEAMAKAERQAGRANSGGNVSNATRQKISSILDIPARSRGFSPEEKAQMETIVKGTPVGNVARYMGNLFGGGGGLGQLVTAGTLGGAGYAYGGNEGAATGLGLASLGRIGKGIEGASTRRQVEKLAEMIRARAPSSTISPSAATAYDPQRAAAIAAILQGQFNAP